MVLDDLSRAINSLKDLSYTHFTIENIKTKYDRLLRNRNRNKNNKNFYKEKLSTYDKFKEEEISKLNNIVDVVQNLLKEKLIKKYFI